MTDFRCADAAFARDEPMFATASYVERWLLVEQSGPFSPESVPASRIPPQALRFLAQLVGQVRARLVLIRRPPKTPAEPGTRVYFADVRPGHERVATKLLAGQSALTELTLDDRDWVALTEPLYLVCTHGKHDPCCAVYGRPLVAALAAALPTGRVWECSHVGGDRFAGNMIALPAGLYLGRVEPEEASALVELIDAGRVPPHYLRGRSSMTAPVQAAQHFARNSASYGSFDAVDDLLPVRTEPAPDDGNPAWTIVLACPKGDVSVTVRRTTAPAPMQLTCHVTQPKWYPQFELVRITS